MMRPTTPTLTASFLITAALALGCTGATLGENQPGADTYLEGSPGYDAVEDGRCAYTGDIATDPGSLRAWTMLSVHQEDCWDVGAEEAADSKVIYAAAPGEAEAGAMLDVSGYQDVRLLQPSAGLVVMAEAAADEGAPDQDTLFLLDPEDQSLVDQNTVDARYHGTRLAPSRRWIAAADNNLSPAPIHVLDPETSLEPTIIPHEGDWLEGMWLSQRDAFAAVIFDLAAETVRMAVWDLEGLGGLDQCDWQSPAVDVTVGEIGPDWSFSYTWIGVSPDDAAVVFPVVDSAAGQRALLVMDPATGEVRRVDDAAGPVGFTPDGGTIVSYRYTDETGEHDPVLLLIDAATLEVTEWPIPMQDGPSYFVTREGSAVVIASQWGGDTLVIYDLETGEYTRVGGPGLSLDLNEFVSRLGHGELWLLSDGLFRLDFVTPTLESIPLSFYPRALNILPQQDLLVMDDEVDPRLIFFEPETRAIHSEARFAEGAESAPELEELSAAFAQKR